MHCFKTCSSLGAHHENLNEDRLYYRRRKCSLLLIKIKKCKDLILNSRFWQYKVYADIRSDFQDLCKFSLDFMPKP